MATRRRNAGVALRLTDGEARVLRFMLIDHLDRVEEEVEVADDMGWTDSANRLKGIFVDSKSIEDKLEDAGYSEGKGKSLFKGL